MNTNLTVEQQAQEYADFIHPPAFSRDHALYNQMAQNAFIAGHASRDEEVKELSAMLRTLLKSMETYMPEFREKWNVMADYERAQILLSKYSPISETEEEPTDLNP